MPEQPSAAEAADVQARQVYLHQQMYNMRMQLRTLSVGMILAVENDELSGEFCEWSYRQLLQLASTLKREQ